MAAIANSTRLINVVEPPPKRGAARTEPTRASGEVQTVRLSRGSTGPRPAAYDQSSGNRATEQTEPRQAKPALAPVEAVRELTPQADHPKMLIACRTFLDIAYYDSNAHLVDVYA